MLFEDKEKPEVVIPRMRIGDGMFVRVRFRNREDLCKFADILDQPHLKMMKKNTVENIVWHANPEKRRTLDSLFGE